MSPCAWTGVATKSKNIAKGIAAAIECLLATRQLRPATGAGVCFRVRAHEGRPGERLKVLQGTLSSPACPFVGMVTAISVPHSGFD